MSSASRAEKAAAGRRQTEPNRLFAEYNRRHWRGRLPAYRVLRRRQIGRDAGTLGRCDDDARTILLRRDLEGEQLRLVLLHEMCHIAQGPGEAHGPRFLRKLRRIAAAGYPQLLEDVEQYDGTAVQREIAAVQARGETIHEQSFRDALLGDLESLALEHWSRRWATARRVLAAQYRLTPAALQRAAPWAAGEWRRLSAWYRSLHVADEQRRRGVLPG